jgi:hypothetical protein
MHSGDLARKAKWLTKNLTNGAEGAIEAKAKKVPIWEKKADKNPEKEGSSDSAACQRDISDRGPHLGDDSIPLAGPAIVDLKKLPGQKSRFSDH